MTALDLPLLAVGTILTVLLFAFGVRRLLGLRLSTLRTLAAGLIKASAVGQGGCGG